jgi:hypothetical protein
MLAAAAEEEDAPFAGSVDILEDEPTLHTLQHSQHLPGLSASERKRAGMAQHGRWVPPDGAAR